MPVTFDNFPWFTDDEISQALKTSVVLFDGTAPDHGTILDDMSAALGKLLSSKGVYGRRLAPARTRSQRRPASPAISRRRGGPDGRRRELFGFAREQRSRDTKQLRQSCGIALFAQRASSYSNSSRFVPRISRTDFCGFVSPPAAAHMQTASSPRYFFASCGKSCAIDPGPAFTWNGVTWTGNSAIQLGATRRGYHAQARRSRGRHENRSHMGARTRFVRPTRLSGLEARTRCRNSMMPRNASATLLRSQRARNIAWEIS